MDRYINLEITGSVIWIVISVLVIIGTLVFTFKFVPYANKRFSDNRWSDWDTLGNTCIMVAIVIVLIMLIVSISQVFDIVTCCIMPEKMILDYLTSVSI